MNNNKNKELVDKLEREIWLFQQWLSAMDSELNETQQRIQTAYQECIIAREKELNQLLQAESASTESQDARAATQLADA